MTPRRVTQMVKNFIWKVAGNDRGAATIEYGLVLGLIAMAIFFILQDLGGMVSTTYD
ncbi:Flp family type IVb pilin, partial [Novosphingobium sp.]|uniref:Flp family type IVb pilin n=1 Tax=Novosphingobium sp. TaxID=1874826 RepID=UPI0034491045